MAHFKRKKARIISGCDKLDRERKNHLKESGFNRWTVGTPPAGYTISRNRKLRYRNKSATRMAAKHHGDDIDVMHVCSKRDTRWYYW